MVGKLTNEPDRIRGKSFVSTSEVDTACCRVEGGEETILNEEVCSGQRTQQGGFPSVRVSDECDAEETRPRLTLNCPCLCHLAELALQLTDARPDQPPVGLELGFTGTTEADTASDTREVAPHPSQARQKVLELSELDLHARLTRASTRGEDVQDELGTIHDADLDQLFEILSLGWTELLVENDQVRFPLLHQLGQRTGFPFPQVVAGVWAVETLDQ